MTTDLYMRKSMFAVGGTRMGKSQLILATGKKNAAEHGMNRVICGKALDPFGCLAKSNQIAQIGAVCISDFDFVTLQNTPLPIEAKKGICKTEEMAEFPARYHVGRMMQYIPR